MFDLEKVLITTYLTSNVINLNYTTIFRSNKYECVGNIFFPTDYNCCNNRILELGDSQAFSNSLPWKGLREKPPLNKLKLQNLTYCFN